MMKMINYLSGDMMTKPCTQTNTRKLKFFGEDLNPNDLPQPSGWRVLIGMLVIETESAGGIALPESHVKDQGYLRQVGKVLAVGPLAYGKADFQNGLSLEGGRTPRPWCQVGDIVIVGQYTGASVQVLNQRVPQDLKIINDADVMAVIQNTDVLSI